MKKQFLSALVAAMSFHAVGCNDNPQATPSPPAPRVELRSMPKVDGPLVKPIEQPAPVVATLTPPEQTKPPLGLEHEDLRAVDHLSRAALLRDQGDHAGALAEAQRAVFDAPEDLEAIERLELLARLNGDRTLRLRALDRIAELRPDDATPLLQKARVQLTMKDNAGAIRTGHEALLRDAQNPELYQAIGRGHLSLGQLAPAIAMFEKVVSLDPNHGHALNNLGFALLRANRDAEAVEVLTRSAELLPKVAHVQNNLGVALERVGRTDDAKRAYLEASFLSPKYVKAQLNVARVSRLASAQPSPTIEQPEVGDDGNAPHTLTDIPVESLYPED